MKVLSTFNFINSIPINKKASIKDLHVLINKKESISILKTRQRIYNLYKFRMIKKFKGDNKNSRSTKYLFTTQNKIDALIKAKDFADKRKAGKEIDLVINIKAVEVLHWGDRIKNAKGGKTILFLGDFH